MSIRRGKGRSPLLRRPVEIREVPAPVAPIPPSPLACGFAAETQDVAAPIVLEARPIEPESEDMNRAAKPSPRSGRGLLAGRRQNAEREPRKVAAVVSSAGVKNVPATRSYWAATGLVTGMLALWLFAPTLRSLAHVWNTEPDYSHGYLVAPFAVLMLWIRRKSLLDAAIGPDWRGIVLLAAGFALRYAGERLFLTPLSGWGMVLWLAGACWLLAGGRVFQWALPALGFLLFMIPLPFRIEQLMSWHLQTWTTQMSAFLFECLGQSAVAEGHTVFVGDNMLEIEQACSGLRMFMGIGAIAYACVLLQRRSRFENLILIAAIAPVAMLANTIRVVVTGFLLPKFAGEETGARLSHDSAGWMMIVVAIALFGLLIFYLRNLFVAVEFENGRQFLKRPASA
jgi:exosortase